MGFDKYFLCELLDEVIDNRGKNPKKYYSSGQFPVIDNVLIKNSFYPDINSAERYIDIDAFNNFLRGYLHKNMPIMTLVGSGIGNVTLSPSDNAVIVQNTIGFKTNGKLNSIYLYYWFLTKQQELKSFNRGSGQPSIRKTDIENMTILIPDINNQNKIVKILSSIDKKIKVNNELNKNFQKLSQELYKRWFVDFEFPDENGKPYKISGGKMVESELGEIPEGWEIKNIKDIAKCVLGGTPSRGNPDFWNGNIAWINSGKINEFRILEPTEYITELGLKKSSTVLLPKKTTVIAITGATLGQVSLLEIDSCANQSVIGIIGNDSKFSEYIYLLINYSIMNIISMQTGGAQQHINKNNVESFKVLVPNKVIIEKFHEIVKPLFEKISLNCFENKNLKNLNTTLLPELLNGTVNVENIEL